MNLRGWILPAAVVLLADAWLLVGVARNRAGEPDAVVELTERELSLVPLGEENTGVALRLGWEGPSVRPLTAAPGWFDEAKLAELGFDLGRLSRFGAAPQFRGSLPKEAYVALEYEGPAWEQWLAARASPEEARAAHTRLFAVDAGRDPRDLRRRYPDRRRYIITRCMVRMILVKNEPRLARGAIPQLLVRDIYVPLPFSRTLAGMGKGQPGAEPRYTVTLRFGRNYEPWVSGCRLLPAAK